MSCDSRIVMGVIGTDIHVVANKIIARGLQEAGFNVCNLGAGCQPRELVAAAIEHAAHAVVISTLGGEGEPWCVSIREDLNTAGAGEVVLYVGGNLGVGQCVAADVEERFLKLGFDRAYHQPASLDILINDLQLDLQ